jgi:predicted phage terminase large subunit-like protein
MDSLLENLMPGSQLASRPRGMDYLVREDLKEYATTKLPWKSIKYRAHTDDFSKLLWPQAKTVDYFKARKEDAVRQGLGDVYSQEMLNLPLDQSNTFFNRSDFIPMKVDDHKKSMIYYATCDLAVSTKERSDYSAFTIAGVDEDGKLYLKNVIRRRMDTLEIVETMFMLQKLYKPVLFGIEQGTIQKSIGPYLNDAMMKRGEFINIVLMKPTADKISRARSMQARMRSGAVKFDNEADWYAPFEDELLKFPRDKHDDQVDAWAYMGMLLDKMWEAPTNLEVEDEEYEAFLKTDNADSGRSVVTGY